MHLILRRRQWPLEGNVRTNPRNHGRASQGLPSNGSLYLRRQQMSDGIQACSSASQQRDLERSDPGAADSAGPEVGGCGALTLGLERDLFSFSDLDIESRRSFESIPAS